MYIATILLAAGSSVFLRQQLYRHLTKSMLCQNLFHANAPLDCVRSGVSLDCIGAFFSPQSNKVNAIFVNYEKESGLVEMSWPQMPVSHGWL